MTNCLFINVSCVRCESQCLFLFQNEKHQSELTAQQISSVRQKIIVQRLHKHILTVRVKFSSAQLAALNFLFTGGRWQHLSLSLFLTLTVCTYKEVELWRVWKTNWHVHEGSTSLTDRSSCLWPRSHRADHCWFCYTRSVMNQTHIIHNLQL